MTLEGRTSVRERTETNAIAEGRDIKRLLIHDRSEESPSPGKGFPHQSSAYLAVVVIFVRL